MLLRFITLNSHIILHSDINYPKFNKNALENMRFYPKWKLFYTSAASDASDKYHVWLGWDWVGWKSLHGAIL